MLAETVVCLQAIFIVTYFLKTGFMKNAILHLVLSQENPRLPSYRRRNIKTLFIHNRPIYLG